VTVRGIIVDYYEQRGLVWPANSYEALAWAHTELAEVYEMLLARSGNWVRNNPEDHPPFAIKALAEEYGDVIMMVMVAAHLDWIDPIKELKEKIERKLKEHYEQGEQGRK